MKDVHDLIVGGGTPAIDPAVESILHAKSHAVARDTLSSTKPRRRIRILPWSIVALLTGAAAGAWVLLRFQEAPAGKPAPLVSVAAATAVKGDLDVTLAALGTVTPLATVSIKARISGHLVRLGFEEGQEVKAGDFLAEIDPRPYQHELVQAQGQLTRDQALLDNARLDLERYRQLVTQNNVSHKQFDTQQSLVRQYEGMVNIDLALLDRARLNLEYCHITAPVSGRVGLRQVDLGNYVQPSDATGIVVITQLQPIAIVFPVAEDHLSTVMGPVLAGKKLPVEAYDRGGARLLAKGTLATIDNQVDPATGTVKFKARFDNTDLALFPNQFVNVHLLVETLQDATLVPSTAIEYGPKGAFVFAIQNDDTVAMRPVTLGPAERGSVAVLAGIEPGVRVVTGGADRLRDGTKVKLVADRKAEASSPDRGGR
ncbi:multidrug transporter subunit MdtA [Beijerinckiaceae bacterium]|nr:multidrug transporter subunit MdtA [Beijerinckiaceae bacterium]